MSGLVLSIFPGLGVWEIPFIEEGFTVVRGPDILLGGDIRNFHVPAGKFDGVIGGIPCQAFSKARRVAGRETKERFGDMTPEFNRIIKEAEPAWWLSENVPQAPLPDGAKWNAVLNAADFGAIQSRARRFCSNIALMPRPAARHDDLWPTVTATEHKLSTNSAKKNARARAGRKVGRRMTLAEVATAFGLPPDWDLDALRVEMKYHMLGNAVPIPMARALARAIKEAI